MPLVVGSKAPDFTLPSTSGRDFNLYKDQKGKPCIIYFYPKNFTNVCTKEACEFRDSHAMFRKLDIDVYGISKDDINSHLKFKKEYELPFDLLADAKGKVADKYEALIPIVRMTRRVTYLLDKDHKVAAVHEDMFSAKKHIDVMIQKVKR
jgi:thioredoxin-dependent peroxiredoxin